MKRVKNCIVENCVPTPTSCLIWNGGDIEYLGICDGDFLNNVIIEIITKLENITGDDLSKFDLDALLEICNAKAPLETNLISILNVLKNNQLCLKDYIDKLSEIISELNKEQGVNVNLKCFDQLDNQGNSLNITRDQLDQLVIDQLCKNNNDIKSLQGNIVDLNARLEEIDKNKTVQELTFDTCLLSQSPTSKQVINTSKKFCEFKAAYGPESDLSRALALTPSDLATEFGTMTGWIAVPANFAQSYNNTLLELESLRQRINFMEKNCCAATCDDIKLGFSALFNEDGDGLIIRFTYGAGTFIPSGFEDKGSRGTITDKNGNIVDFNLEIGNNSEDEIIITGLDFSEGLDIDITAVLGTDTLTCQKCLSKKITLSSAKCCIITNTSDEEITIVYETTTQS